MCPHAPFSDPGAQEKGGQGASAASHSSQLVALRWRPLQVLADTAPLSLQE